MAKKPLYKQHEVTVSCSCKNTFKLFLTEDMPKQIAVEKCNNCHEAYQESGKVKTKHTQKQVEKFRAKRDFSHLFEE